ncbi:MAG TPA: LysR family transcriptional regulator [Povalibacter sp.]|nr:LysR family transcriptional regulator [Povalibacter sp.]
MELRQLQYFLAVADNGSLSKASAVLGIAQPALSRAVRQLEEAVETPLFYRHGRGIRLTEKGTQFRATIEPLVRSLLQATDDLKASAGVPAGSISFGMPPSMSAAVGACLVETFLERYPQVKLQIIDAFSGYLNEWLVAGRLDLAIINGARRSAHIDMDPLLTVDLFHVARHDMVASSERDKTTVEFDRLLDSPLILPGRHHGLRRQLDAAAQSKGAKLNVIVEIDALEALKELVRRGAASTVLPHGAILKEADDPEFIVRRLVAPDVTMQFMIAYSLQRPTTLAMRELVRILRTEVSRALIERRMIGRLWSEP